MPLRAGDRFGPYELLANIGEGGMGEVWKARDTRLDRVVALKVCKERFSERFGTEARTVASLNHPHICTLYDVGPDFLVMEFIDGVPLAGPMPVEKAVVLAGMILDALDAAHKKGIVHRDLKPGNILVTKQGIKLLDFGLATAAARRGPEDATETAVTGEIAGTLQYMSPEQLQGKPVDARSDLFAFGCVFYEMISGRRAFSGVSTASVIAAILEREPAALDLAGPLDKVWRKCLAKDPDQRFQTAMDLRWVLLWAAEPVAPGAGGPSKKWPAAVMVLASIALGLGWMAWRTEKPPAPARFTRITRDGVSRLPALSPDGKLLAFASSRAGGNVDIYIQQADGTAPVRITDDRAVDSNPAFSADGSKIFFDSNREPPGIYEVSALGGDARLAIPDARRPRPSPDAKRIAYVERSRWVLNTMPGGQAVDLGPLRTQAPLWSPDGSRLLILGVRGPEILSMDGGERKLTGLLENLTRRQMTGGFNRLIRWLPGDEILMSANYADAHNLWRIPLSEAAHGEPIPVTSGNSTRFAGGDAVGRRVAIAPVTGVEGLWSLPVDLDAGKVLGPARKLVAGDVDGNHPDISADGTQMVYCSMRNGPQGIWIRNLQTGKDRLIAQPNRYGNGYSHTVISPDGKWVAAAMNEPGGEWRLVLFQSAGGEAKPLSKEGARLRGWTPDGRLLLLWMRRATDGLSVLDVASLVQTEIVRGGSEARLSRDGKWLAFMDAERKLYIAPFRGAVPIPDAERILIAEGVGHPAWAPKGDSLYYVKGSGLNESIVLAEMFRQAVDPRTKQPVGAATLFHTFDGMSFRGSVDNPIAVGKSEIILSMGAVSSDIWTVDLPSGR